LSDVLLPSGAGSRKGNLQNTVAAPLFAQIIFLQSAREQREMGIFCINRYFEDWHGKLKRQHKQR